MKAKKGSTLGGGKVHGATSYSGSSIITLNVYAKSIVDQAALPKLDVKGLKDVNTHLTTAQAHADKWLNVYSKDAWNRLQGVISFGELFTNLYKPLYAAAEKMGTEKEFRPNEIYKLIGALQAMQTLVKKQAAESQQCYSEITGYKDLVTKDHRIFKADYNTAVAELGGTKGEIAQLEKDIRAWQDGQNFALAVGGIGATIMVVGGLIIAVGALAEFETAGLSTALVIGGIAVVAVGAVLTVGSITTYEVGQSIVAKKMKQLANDKVELAALTALRGQITGINDTLNHAEAALSNLVTAWQQMDNAIDAIIADLQNPQDYLAKIKEHDPTATPLTASMIVCAELETANDDWDATVKYASALLDKGRNIKYIKVMNKLPTQKTIEQVIASQAA